MRFQSLGNIFSRMRLGAALVSNMARTGIIITVLTPTVAETLYLRLTSGQTSSVDKGFDFALDGKKKSGYQ
jgi:hypothetical protein